MPQRPPLVAAQLGQAVGEAQRALARLQSGVLDAVGTNFETWVTLNTIVTRRPSLNAEHLNLDLATISPALTTAIGFDEQHVRTLLERLITDGLIEQRGEEIALSDAGKDLHRRVRTGSMASTERLINGADVAAVEQTVRTLRELTARAQGLLAGSEV